MSRYSGTILDRNVPAVVKVSRVGTILVLGLLLAIQYMILAI